MQLSIKGTAMAGGLVWGAAILLVGLINLARPEFGTSFLNVMTSIYPWFHSSHTIGSVIIGTIDGLIDGAVAGCLFAWLYNMMQHTSSKPTGLQEHHI
jgi:hypothetical protein